MTNSNKKHAFVNQLSLFYLSSITVVDTDGYNGPITDRQTCHWDTTTTNRMSLSDNETAFIAFISTFIILSFLGNVCVVVVIMKIKTLRTVTNMFLTNLAVSDMILVSLIMPLQVHDMSHTDEYDESKLHVACPMLLRNVKTS